MARTRASKSSEKAAGTESSSAKSVPSDTKYTLSAPPKNPPRIFILPTKASKDARIVSLLHPRYAKPTRYLVCQETGFYEITRISAPKTTPRSWLIQTDTNSSADSVSSDEEDSRFDAYVTNGAEVFVATPFDPLFLILPTLVDPASSRSAQKEKRRYISSDDHFDRIQDQSPHLWETLRWGKEGVRELLEARLAAVCDTAEAGDERMYRFNEDKLVAEMAKKAKRMSAKPLPRSMEDKFVTRPLEAPLMGVKRGEPATSAESQEETTSGTSTPTPKVGAGESQDSLSSVDSGESLVSDVSTAATSVAVPEDTAEPGEEAQLENQTTTAAPTGTSEPQLQPAMAASPEVISLQRLRTAFNFLCSAYIPRQLAEMLQTRLGLASTLTSAELGVDFAPLDAYLTELNRLKQEAAAARSAGDYGRKRVLDDDEIAERAEKKRKKEEEDKRKKAGESRGVRNLKKVDTTGMKKMSDFFKKKV
ncbi:ribonuclease H2, subunit B [Xylariaceae sp. FL0594]|nr:ribonuclease H2, subunit B [Xylariaceae sp. FL0594]